MLPSAELTPGAIFCYEDDIEIRCNFWTLRTVSNAFLCSILKVNGRIIKKQLHVAVPHVRPSTCQKQIIERKKENERIKSEVRAGADRVLLKR